MNNKTNRREFISKVGIMGAAAAFGAPFIINASSSKPAVLGGSKAVGNSFPRWPIFSKLEEEAVQEVVKSRVWGRLAANTKTAKFENEYKNITGAKHALAVSSGTNALFCMLGALEIGPGDEVIIPPYTFIATYNAIGLHYGLPVFVDTDIETFQIDPKKIATAINKNTKAIMPVHIGGNPYDIDAVNSISKKYSIPVIEDACQAHLAEWNGKCVGNFGLGGGFSFQASKNLNSGEGGAIITNDDNFYQKCYSFHHQGQTSNSAGLGTGSGIRGSNLRITEFQSTILSAQMTRLKEQFDKRWENAQYLSKLLNEVPGIKPAKLSKGTTRSAYHLYMFRFDSKQFAGMTKEKFIGALGAEGFGASSGYGMTNKENFVVNLAKSRHYLKVYGEKRMKLWLEQTMNTPVNDRLTKEAVWFGQTTLLGSRSDMDQIAEAVRKIHKNANKLK